MSSRQTSPFTPFSLEGNDNEGEADFLDPIDAADEIDNDTGVIYNHQRENLRTPRFGFSKTYSSMMM